MADDYGQLKAIETVYNGHRFRSRLEARWAVFMDSLGIKYDYEAQGYDLDGLWYLPDFWLPEIGGWLEVKGPPMVDFDETWEKARRLAETAEKLVWVFCGPISTPNNTSGHEFWGGEGDQYVEKYGINIRPIMVWWFQCPVCLKFQPGEYAHLLPCKCFDPFRYPDINERLQAACERARHARFEHGETPT